MPQVTFIAHDGRPHTVQASIGTSLMQTALDHGVKGIDGDCGGQCACATCHVFVAPEWQDRVGPRNAQEDGMLAFASELRDSSRLACQIPVTAALDGLVVHLPEGQH